MLMVLNCDMEAGERAADAVMSIAAERGALFAGLGLIAIGGAAEDVGVGTPDSGAAEAGREEELGEPSVTVVIESALNGAVSSVLRSKATFVAAAMAAAMPMAAFGVNRGLL
jgi:hypothetical protein